MNPGEIINFNLDIFKTLYAVDVSPFISFGDFGFGDVPYLEWASAWRLLKEQFPQAESIIHTNPEGLPFFKSEFGLFVHVSVKVNDTIVSDWYDVEKNKNSAADITKAHQRALVKCCGRLGLGLKLWEDKERWKVTSITPQEQNAFLEKAKELGWKGEEVRDLLKSFGYETITAISQVSGNDYDRIYKELLR